MYFIGGNHVRGGKGDLQYEERKEIFELVQNGTNFFWKNFTSMKIARSDFAVSVVNDASKFC